MREADLSGRRWERATRLAIAIGIASLAALLAGGCSAPADSIDERKATALLLCQLADDWENLPYTGIRSHVQARVAEARKRLGGLERGTAAHEEARKALQDLYENYWERDAWGNPIVFLCPGRIHKNGYDLVSFGPNGIDEGGKGDDIVLGRDDFDGTIGEFKVLESPCRVICHTDPAGNLSYISVQSGTTSLDRLAKIEEVLKGLHISLVLKDATVRQGTGGACMSQSTMSRGSTSAFFEFGKRAQGRGAHLLLSGTGVSEDFPVMDERGRPFWELVGADFPDDLESTEAH